LPADVEGQPVRGLQKGNAGLKDRGVKKAPFVVLIGANMPSILAEISFVTNPKDAEQLQEPEYRQRVAESLYKGVAKYEGGLSGTLTGSRNGIKERIPVRQRAWVRVAVLTCGGIVRGCGGRSYCAGAGGEDDADRAASAAAAGDAGQVETRRRRRRGRWPGVARRSRRARCLKEDGLKRFARSDYAQGTEEENGDGVSVCRRERSDLGVRLLPESRGMRRRNWATARSQTGTNC
jgi:hypothetical protein